MRFPPSSRWLALYVWRLALGGVWAHGNYPEQLGAVNARLQAAPTNAEVRLDRARVYLEHEELAPAREDLETAEKLAPGMARRRFLQAQWERLSGHWEAARTEVEAYLERVPADAAAHWERLEILCQQQETTLALAEADHLLATSTERLPELVLQRTQLLAQTEVAAALAWIDAWMEEHQRLAVWEQEALRLEIQLARPAAVRARFARLRSRAARKEFLWLKEAQYCQTLPDSAGAREAAQQCLAALKILPTHLQGLPATLDVQAAAVAIALTP